MSGGLPAPTSIATYGGVLQNYAPVEDASTDLDAAAGNQQAADVAAMTHTATRAWVRFVGHATTPTLANPNPHDAMWGTTNGTPTVVKGGTGIYDLTWPATYVDELGVTQTLNLRAPGDCIVEGASPIGAFTLTLTGANTARLRIWSTAFALADFAGTTFCVSVM